MNYIKYGLLPDPNEQIAWQFMGATQIENDIVVDDWTPYLPDPERQKKMIETMACVSFSACNCLETIFNYYMANKMINIDDYNWLYENGYINNSKVNFSDRFLAKMSNTTQDGNYYSQVGDAARKFGMVAEQDWPYGDDIFSWDEYYKEIPQEIKDKGLEFLKRFPINYEFVQNANIPDALKHSPLQVGVYAWPTPVDGKYDMPSGARANHAVEDYKVVTIFDTYNPFIKELVENYPFGSSLKYKVKINRMDEFLKTKDSPNIYRVFDGKKQLIVDMDTLNELYPGRNVFEVDSLDKYADGGTIVWVNRQIN